MRSACGVSKIPREDVARPRPTRPRGATHRVTCLLSVLHSEPQTCACPSEECEDAGRPPGTRPERTGRPHPRPPATSRAGGTAPVLRALVALYEWTSPGPRLAAACHSTARGHPSEPGTPPRSSQGPSPKPSARRGRAGGEARRSGSPVTPPSGEVFFCTQQMTLPATNVKRSAWDPGRQAVSGGVSQGKGQNSCFQTEMLSSKCHAGASGAVSASTARTARGRGRIHDGLLEPSRVSCSRPDPRSQPHSGQVSWRTSLSGQAAPEPDSSRGDGCHLPVPAECRR